MITPPRVYPYTSAKICHVTTKLIIGPVRWCSEIRSLKSIIRSGHSENVS